MGYIVTGSSSFPSTQHLFKRQGQSKYWHHSFSEVYTKNLHEQILCALSHNSWTSAICVISTNFPLNIIFFKKSYLYCPVRENSFSKTKQYNIILPLWTWRDTTHSTAVFSSWRYVKQAFPLLSSLLLMVLPMYVINSLFRHPSFFLYLCSPCDQIDWTPQSD